MRCPYRLRHFNTLSPVGGDIWGCLGCVDLLEEVGVTSLKADFESLKVCVISRLLSLLPACGLRCEVSALPTICCHDSLS